MGSNAGATLGARCWLTEGRLSRGTFVIVAALGAAFLILEICLMNEWLFGIGEQTRIDLTFFAVIASLTLAAYDILKKTRSPVAIASVYLGVAGVALVGPEGFALSSGFSRFSAAAILGGVVIALPTVIYFVLKSSVLPSQVADLNYGDAEDKEERGHRDAPPE